MNTSRVISITDLPTEVIEHIAQFLSVDDIYACVTASAVLSDHLNINRVWKKLCCYPEKYFKADMEKRLQGGKNCENWCNWRKYCELQKRVNENWNKGLFSVEKTGVFDFDENGRMLAFIDDHGRHWLLVVLNDDITILDITNTPRIQWKVPVTFSVRYIKNTANKVLICGHYGFVEVYQFEAPKYEMICEYKFYVDKEGVFCNNYRFEINSLAFYNYDLINNLLIGHNPTVTLRETFLHIWDINSATKLSPTPTAYQESFLEFVYSSRGIDMSDQELVMEIKIASEDPERILISLSDIPSLEYSQISLFSLVEMKIVNVIVQFYGFIRYLLVKGDLVLCVVLNDDNHIIAVHNIHGDQLIYMEFPYFPGAELPISVVQSNPSALITDTDNTHHQSKLILCSGYTLQIFYITDSELKLERKLYLDKNLNIKWCINSRLLVLEDCSTSTAALEVWDIEAGLKLWTLKKICYFNFLEDIAKTYPSKILVKLIDEDEFSILNFEKGGYI